MALHFAATQGATDIVKLMISSYTGSRDIVNAVDGNQETLLHRQVAFHMLSTYCWKKLASMAVSALKLNHSSQMTRKQRNFSTNL